MQASEDLHSDAEMEYASAEEVDFNEDANDSSGQEEESSGNEDGQTDNDDEEYEEEEESDDDDTPTFLNLISHNRNVYAHILENLPRISTFEPPQLNHELADELNMRTSALAPGTPQQLLSGYPNSASTPRRGGQPVVNAYQLQLLREGGHSRRSATGSDAACGHFSAFHRLPTKPTKVVERMQSRGYIGQFTKDGELFVGAFQSEKRICMYDVANGWKKCKDVHARNLRWTVTDIALSTDQKFLLYSSITPTVHLVNVDRGNNSTKESIANVTDIHEALQLGNPNHSNGIWSLKWSEDNREIAAGTADSSLYIYDVSQGKTVVKVQGHDDDVNAVAYADPSCQIIYTGSDDNMIKVWDRRLISNRRGTPVGVFVGHMEGITFLDSKGDGRYVISNSKDQTIKLWDLRKTRSQKEAISLAREFAKPFPWDYRWMSWPAADCVMQHKKDGSLATYRGHSVLSTLIRAYWSPVHTTGQRYIYSASADGAVRIWDVVTCKEVSKLAYHREVVRDCSWHPFLPLLATVSFDGTICTFEPEVPGEKEACRDEAEAVAKRKARDVAVERKAEMERENRRSALRTRGGGSDLPAPGVDQYSDWL